MLKLIGESLHIMKSNSLLQLTPLSRVVAMWETG